MLSSYFNITVQSFVVILLVKNLSCIPPEIPPPATLGERLCRAHINEVFKTLSNARACAEYAFLYLKDNAPEFKEHIAAEMYYESFKLYIHSGLVSTPEEFCDEYSSRTPTDASSSAPIVGYTKVSKETCTRILMTKCFVPGITYSNRDAMMKRIVDYVYANESIKDEPDQEYNPLIFRELNQEYIDTMANFVVHVSERFLFEGVPENPIDFCRNDMFNDISIFSQNMQYQIID